MMASWHVIGSKTMSVVVQKASPTITLTGITINKTSVKPGDDLVITASVIFENPTETIPFKLSVSAFGKTYTTAEFRTTLSQFTLPIKIQVPIDVEPGTYGITATLYAYY